MEKTLHQPEYQILLDLLRQARLDAGVTQEDLARILDSPRSTVTKWETGHQRLDILEFWRWCEALGVDPLGLLLAFREARKVPRSKHPRKPRVQR